MKFVLLHDAKGDDGVKAFFTEVWELYVKVRVMTGMGRSCTHFRCLLITDNDESIPYRSHTDPEPDI